MTPTLEARLAEVLPCAWTDAKIAGVRCAEPECNCTKRPAVLALIREVRQATIEECLQHTYDQCPGCEAYNEVALLKETDHD